MEILEVPFYDDDFVKLAGRFAINFVVMSVLVRFVYYRRSLSKDYLFTYYMLSAVVFFICFTLKKLELELGMAMGLFAVFGVLRYRTTMMPVREMSYLFTVIGIAIINSLANLKVSWSELIFVNGAFIAVPAILESLTIMRHELGQEILYERIDLIRPENYHELIADLQLRTGLQLTRIEIGKIDLLKDTVAITAYYYPHQQPANESGEVGIARRVRPV